MSDLELVQATLSEVVKSKAPGVGVKLTHNEEFSTTTLSVGLRATASQQFADESLAAIPESLRLDELSQTALSLLSWVQKQTALDLGLPKPVEHEVWRRQMEYRVGIETFDDMNFDVRDDGSAVISYDDLKKILHESGHWKTGMGRKY